MQSYIDRLLLFDFISISYTPKILSRSSNRISHYICAQSPPVIVFCFLSNLFAVVLRTDCSNVATKNPTPSYCLQCVFFPFNEICRILFRKVVTRSENCDCQQAAINPGSEKSGHTYGILKIRLIKIVNRFIQQRRKIFLVASKIYLSNFL